MLFTRVAVGEEISSGDPDRSLLQRPADRTSSFTFIDLEVVTGYSLSLCLSNAWRCNSYGCFSFDLSFP